MLSSTHIINRLPMSNLSWKSPFEVLYNQTPDCSCLRTIGCLCYASNLGERDKFEPRAHKCILLGYTFGYKGYKLFDLQTKKIFHSRDVLFKENVFPFKNSTVTHLSDPDKAAKDPIFPFLVPSFVPDSPQFHVSSPPVSFTGQHNPTNSPLTMFLLLHPLGHLHLCSILM